MQQTSAIPVEVKGKDIPRQRLILVSADPMGFKGVVVCSDHGTIMDTYNMDHAKLRKVLISVKRALSVDPDKIYSSAKAWQDFCNDVVLYYAIQKALYGKEIPMLPSCMAPKLGFHQCVRCGKQTSKKCSKCGTKYCSRECQLYDRQMHKGECSAAHLLTDKKIMVEEKEKTPANE